MSYSPPPPQRRLVNARLWVISAWFAAATMIWITQWLQCLTAPKWRINARLWVKSSAASRRKCWRNPFLAVLRSDCFLTRSSTDSVDSMQVGNGDSPHWWWLPYISLNEASSENLALHQGSILRWRLSLFLPHVYFTVHLNHKRGFNSMLKVIDELIWFCFTPLRDWFKKARAVYLTNQMQKQNHPRLERTRFPALGAVYVYLLRVLIGSFCYLRLLWLAIVIA